MSFFMVVRSSSGAVPVAVDLAGGPGSLSGARSHGRLTDLFRRLPARAERAVRSKIGEIGGKKTRPTAFFRPTSTPPFDGRLGQVADRGLVPGWHEALAAGTPTRSMWVLGEGMTVALELIPPEAEAALPDDQTLIEALKRGDEAAFVALVETYQGLLIRLGDAVRGAHGRWPRTWSRRPGSACCAGWIASRRAAASRPGSAASWSTGPGPGPARWPPRPVLVLHGPDDER